MANSVADELRKAFDHVGLRVDLVHIGYRDTTLGGPDTLEQYSFWVPDTYRFQGHNPGHQWRRVEDESPEDGTEVLVWPRNGHVVEQVLYSSREDGYLTMNDGYLTSRKPTHWMPLPAPPSD